jgi:hypothetical protein
MPADVLSSFEARRKAAHLRMTSPLRIKPEMHHVAVGDDIFLAFKTQLAGIARTGLAAQRDVIVIRDGLGADEALLEIGVNDARRRRALGALGDGPGARFLRADLEIFY